MQLGEPLTKEMQIFKKAKDAKGFSFTSTRHRLVLNMKFIGSEWLSGRGSCKRSRCCTRKRRQKLIELNSEAFNDEGLMLGMGIWILWPRMS